MRANPALTRVTTVKAAPTWGQGHAVAVDDGPLLLFLLPRRLNAGLLHVADRLVALPLALRAGSGAREQLLRHI